MSLTSRPTDQADQEVWRTLAKHVSQLCLDDVKKKIDIFYDQMRDIRNAESALTKETAALSQKAAEILKNPQQQKTLLEAITNIHTAARVLGQQYKEKFSAKLFDSLPALKSKLDQITQLFTSFESSLKVTQSIRTITQNLKDIQEKIIKLQQHIDTIICPSGYEKNSSVYATYSTLHTNYQAKLDEVSTAFNERTQKEVNPILDLVKNKMQLLITPAEDCKKLIDGLNQLVQPKENTLVKQSQQIKPPGSK